MTEQRDDDVPQEQTEVEVDPPARGGSLPGIRAALSRPAGAGPAHWGGTRPRRDPVPPGDVAT
ncbi:calcium-binding protein [Nocardiopsis tropica]|uniref:Calcium-binding protein n=1 Tax=Nocardiopsis tropica TaxID=109330 RepID=A0ABU7L2C3_9ACTN|nr:calcium-binding protein [Nocardiopsis umidischolae]MEE2055477.1 calcium-binding protein [Nocardiopsis umidischolae]